MATHKLPPNTKNLSVNLPEVSKAALGRLAFVRGQFAGELVRELVREELSRALARGEIVREVARDAIAALSRPKSLGLALIGALSLFCGMPRRSSRLPCSRPRVVSMARIHRKIDETGVLA